MRETFNHLDWSAIAMALIFSYIPVILLSCTAAPALWSLAFWFLAPFAGGYMAARSARTIPLAHGLAVAIVSLIVLTAIGAIAPIGLIVWIPLQIFLSVSGARVWRKRERRGAR